MSSLLPLSTKDLSSVCKNWGWFLLWGIALIALGIAAISAASLTTMISILFIGTLLIIGGVVIIIDSFTTWYRKWGGFTVHLIVGILYLLAGITIVSHPVMGSLSLTLLLGIVYVIVGVFRITYSVSMRVLEWKWGLLNGLIAILIGVLILSSWPASGLFVIGLFIGIDLLFAGLTYIMTAVSARALCSSSK